MSINGKLSPRLCRYQKSRLAMPKRSKSAADAASGASARKPTAEKPAQPVRLLDIARAAGVSRTVVGQVLNGGKGNSRVAEATAKHILNVADRMSYRPNLAAQQLRGKRTLTYGVMVASAGDPLSSFLVQHIDTEAVKSGCHTMIGNTIGCTDLGPNQFDYHVEEFTRRAVDGVFCAVHNWFEGDRRALVARHPNTVFYGDPGVQGVHSVVVDRAAAIRAAVGHLVERGRRRIALAVADLKKPSCRARLEGYRDALAEADIPYRRSLVFDAGPHGAAYAIHDPENLLWDFNSQPIDLALDALVRDGRCDSIVAYDDFWAAVILRRLRARGISVPNDIAVVGYVNHYLADWTDPPLTSVDLQHQVAAKRMIEMMEQIVESGPLPEDERQIVVQPRLIVRQST